MRKNYNPLELNNYPIKEYNREIAHIQLELNNIRNYIKWYFAKLFIQRFKEETQNLSRYEIKQKINNDKNMLLAYKLSKVAILIGKIRINISSNKISINIPLSKVYANNEPTVTLKNDLLELKPSTKKIIIRKHLKKSTTQL